MNKNLRKNKLLWKPSNNTLETIIKASNDRINGMVLTDRYEYSVDYIMRQLDFGFLKLLPPKPSPATFSKVGMVVKCQKDTQFAKKGDVGVCYQVSHNNEITLCGFIFENRYYDSFSLQDISKYFLAIGFCEELRSYDGSSVNQLEMDYIHGVFDIVFKEEKYLKFYGDRSKN